MKHGCKYMCVHLGVSFKDKAMRRLTYRRVISAISQIELLRVWDYIFKKCSKSLRNTTYDHILNKGKDAVFLQRKYLHETIWSSDKLEVNEGDKTSSKHTWKYVGQECIGYIPEPEAAGRSYIK